MAATLWPGAAGPAARANLRTAVWALRKAVGDDALITSRTAVGLRSEAITVDLADGQRRAAAGDVAAAAALCRGEVLPGYAEDWAEAARRRQRAELAETLAARSAAAERDGDAASAARWSRLRCELDPLNEAAHADLVRQLAAAGDRAGALVAGREVTDRLRAELSVRPGPSLRAALAEALGWLGQDADFEREWQAALELLPEERQSVAWSRRGQVHRTVVCNPRASLAAYQRAWELLPADAAAAAAGGNPARRRLGRVGGRRSGPRGRAAGRGGLAGHRAR